MWSCRLLSPLRSFFSTWLGLHSGSLSVVMSDLRYCYCRSHCLATRGHVQRRVDHPLGLRRFQNSFGNFQMAWYSLGHHLHSYGSYSLEWPHSFAIPWSLVAWCSGPSFPLSHLPGKIRVTSDFYYCTWHQLLEAPASQWCSYISNSYC